MAGVVVIVGRANVGKSTIFNRIVGERISIVEDIAGVTRDRIYATASWLTKEFRLIDTGGIELKDASFTTQIKMQAEIAIEEADLIIFVVNGREGVTQEDEYVARLLQKTKKPILLAVNKIDDGAFINDIYDFYSLGIGDPIPVSGSHGIGIGDLLDEVIKKLDFTEEEFAEDEIRFSIIGRPNVGKSSLTNAILGEERVIALIIGNSISSYFFASSYITLQVLIPSHVFLLFFINSLASFVFPISTPAWKFLEWTEEHVTIKSPTPVNPI